MTLKWLRNNTMTKFRSIECAMIKTVTLGHVVHYSSSGNNMITPHDKTNENK